MAEKRERSWRACVRWAIFGLAVLGVSGPVAFSEPSTTAAMALPGVPGVLASPSPPPAEPPSPCPPQHFPYLASINFVTALNPRYHVVVENSRTTVGFDITSPVSLKEAVVHIELLPPREGAGPANYRKCHREVRSFTAGQRATVSLQYTVPPWDSILGYSSDDEKIHRARVSIFALRETLTYYYSGFEPVFKVARPY